MTAPTPDVSGVEDIVYRRIRDDAAHIVPVEGGGVRASSAAFEDDDDGMSVFVASILEELGLGPADVITGLGGNYRVAALSIAELKLLGLQIVADPDPADAAPHPCSQAHALAIYPPGLSGKQQLKVGKKLAKLATLVDI